MLFGEGTDTNTAHRLLDAALDVGVTLFDTAEMYPVPQSADTQGASERILGDWLQRVDRCACVLACVCGAHQSQPVVVTAHLNNLLGAA